MTAELVVKNGHSEGAATALEQVVMHGDLKSLNAKQRLAYYSDVCQSVGLNPMTRPFDYINLNGKLTLYARKDCTDQLRRVNGVSINRLDKERDGDLYVVTAYANDSRGRSDSDIGAVNVKGLAGEALANAMMKAVTKAKRRVTLSLSGLGWLDETEVDSIQGARHVAVDMTTGELLDGNPGIVEAPRFNDAEADEAAANHDTGKKRTSTADANENNLRKQGILSHKGWMKHRELDPEDKDLSRHLLSLALDAPVASRADLTGEQWQKANAWLDKLDPAALLGLVDAHRQVRELSDPFADDSEVVEGSLV